MQCRNVAPFIVSFVMTSSLEYSTARKITIHNGDSFRAMQVFVLGHNTTVQCWPPKHKLLGILMANDKLALMLQGFHAFKDAHLGALFKASGV